MQTFVRRCLLLLTVLLAHAGVGHAQSVSNCTNSLSVATGTLTASTQLIAAPAATYSRIHVCSFVIQIQQGSSAVNWGLVSGTGAVCATGQAPVTPMFLGSAGAQQSIAQTYGSNALNLPFGAGLCLSLPSAPTGAVVLVTYAVY